jgi:hypothetical protein
MTRDELHRLAIGRHRTPFRGKDIKQLEIPWLSREIVHTCSNGWTIEIVDLEDFWLEGLLMGHCLGLENGPISGAFKSLRSEKGKPHVTIDWNRAIGRCNQEPPRKYQELIWEWNESIRAQTSWGIDDDKRYHEKGVLSDMDYRDLDYGHGYRDERYTEKRGV